MGDDGSQMLDLAIFKQVELKNPAIFLKTGIKETVSPGQGFQPVVIGAIHPGRQVPLIACEAAGFKVKLKNAVRTFNTQIYQRTFRINQSDAFKVFIDIPGNDVFPVGIQLRDQAGIIDNQKLLSSWVPDSTAGFITVG